MQSQIGFFAVELFFDSIGILPGKWCKLAQESACERHLFPYNGNYGPLERMWVVCAAEPGGLALYCCCVCAGAACL
jgi:hypothetical protein